jgi:hypothetical protein
LNDKKTIFSTGEITYDKEWYIKQGLIVKPVVYNDSFLKEIASNTVGSSLELTHGTTTNDVVGYVNDFDFDGENLVANVSTNEKLDGLGFSPEFEVSFIDKGTVYEATDGKLLKTILTDQPRSHILYNSTSTSISTDDGGSQMNEELIETLNKQIKDLNRQIAVLENKNEANQEKLREYDSLKEQIETLTNENNAYKIQIEGLTPKAEAYSKIEANMKAELLDKAFGDDDEAKKAWKDASMEQLESLAKHREITREANGIGANNAEGFDEGDDGETEPNKAEDALAFYKKTHNGEEPEFLKQQGGV